MLSCSSSSSSMAEHSSITIDRQDQLPRPSRSIAEHNSDSQDWNLKRKEDHDCIGENMWLPSD